MSYSKLKYLSIITFLICHQPFFSQSQDLLIRNQKGKIIKTVKPGTELRIKLYPQFSLSINTNNIDSVISFDFDGEKYLESHPVNLSLLKDSVYVMNYFSAELRSNKEGNMQVGFLTKFEVETNDLLNDDEYFYHYDDVHLKHEHYPSIPISNIQQLYAYNKNREVASTLVNIIGIGCMVFSPVIAFDYKTESIDLGTLAIIGGAGLGIYFGGKITFNYLEHNVGYFTTNPDDIKNFSEKYIYIKLE